MSGAARGRRRTSLAWFVVAGITLSALLAFAVAPHASSQPDGFARVAIDHGLGSGRPHPLAGSPLADHHLDGVRGGGLGRGVAGVVGVAITFLVGLGMAHGLRVVARRRRAEARLATGLATGPSS